MWSRIKEDEINFNAKSAINHDMQKVSKIHFPTGTNLSVQTTLILA